MVTDIGSTAYKVCISDHASKTGTYNVYLNPKKSLPEIWEFPSIIALEVAGDFSTMSKSGVFKFRKSFKDCKYANTKASFDNLKKALTYWNNNDTLLYLFCTNASSEAMAQWPNLDTLAMETIRCKVERLVITDEDSENITFNLDVARSNTA